MSASLWQLKREQLIEVCRRLKCPGLDDEEPISKTKRALIQLVENTFDTIETSESEETVEQCYVEISTFVTELMDSRNQPIEKPLRETSKLHHGMEDLPLLVTPIKTTSSSPKTQLESGRTLQEVTLRREFKICGQIGEQGQKDKLSYLSLVRQIETGVERGYSEIEIVEAVIRAISPGMALRDMLEIKRGLTLSKLFTILKGHYKVDSPTELYHQLINISQEPKETALNFVFRAIELKDKLLWKAANEEVDELYSRATVQRKFLRSIETGLLSDSIKYQLLPLLGNMSITDEELIEKVNEASKLENERLEKRKRSTAAKFPKIQALQTEAQAPQTPVHGATSLQDPHARVAVKTIKGKSTKSEDVDPQPKIEELCKEMRQMFMAVMGTSPGSSHLKQRDNACSTCRKNGSGENCRHCFKCGQEGHYSRGCRAPRPPSGNGEGLL